MNSSLLKSTTLIKHLENIEDRRKTEEVNETKNDKVHVLRFDLLPVNPILMLLRPTLRRVLSFPNELVDIVHSRIIVLLVENLSNMLIISIPLSRKRRQTDP
jgi:hypothetical protein